MNDGTGLGDILFGAKQPFMNYIIVILHMPSIRLTLTSQFSQIKTCSNSENSSKNDRIAVLQKVNWQLLDYRVRNQILPVNDYPREQNQVQYVYSETSIVLAFRVVRFIHCCVYHY